MKYLFLGYFDENDWAEQGDSGAPREDCKPELDALVDAGRCLGGGRLLPPTTATSVRIRQGKRLVTDGPFIETREQIAGYLVIDAENLDDAIGIATRLLGSRLSGGIEIRPVSPIHGMAERSSVNRLAVPTV